MATTYQKNVHVIYVDIFINWNSEVVKDLISLQN